MLGLSAASASTIALPNCALNSIAFLPHRSAKIPHIGELRNMAMPLPPAAIHDQNAASLSLKLPNSLMNSGMKG